MRKRRAVARVRPVLAATSLTVCRVALVPKHSMISSPRESDWLKSRERSVVVSVTSAILFAGSGRPARTLESDQHPVAPRDALIPLGQRQLRASLSGHLPDQIVSPRVILTAERAHAGVGVTHPRPVHGDPSTGVEVNRLERADHGPTAPKALTYDTIEFIDADDSV